MIPLKRSAEGWTYTVLDVTVPPQEDEKDREPSEMPGAVLVPIVSVPFIMAQYADTFRESVALGDYPDELRERLTFTADVLKDLAEQFAEMGVNVYREVEAEKLLSGDVTVEDILR